MEAWQIILIILAVLILVIIILPLFNRSQLKKMPVDQQILIIMKQAKDLVFFKNISSGRTGNLCFVKNKRKILVYPWILNEKGEMQITKENPFDRWDYPEDRPLLNADEIAQARKELINYSKKSSVRIVWNDKAEQDEAENEPD